MNPFSVIELFEPSMGFEYKNYINVCELKRFSQGS